MKILILCCGGNSCRSLMAKALLQQTDQSLEVISAGLNPQELDPMAVKVMNEIGIDISNEKNKSYNLFEGILVDYLITLCNGSRDKILPATILYRHKINLEFDDPRKRTSQKSKNIEIYREIRDEIKHELHYFYARILTRQLISKQHSTDPIIS